MSAPPARPANDPLWTRAAGLVVTPDRFSEKQKVALEKSNMALSAAAITIYHACTELQPGADYDMGRMIAAFDALHHVQGLVHQAVQLTHAQPKPPHAP